MADVDDRPRQLLIKTEREEDCDNVRLTVRDAGVGLSPQSLDSLFDAFHKTKSGGMGIGLFISRSIIERHNGRLWAEPNQILKDMLGPITMTPGPNGELWASYRLNTAALVKAAGVLPGT
jgi:signal transduction histidine kinase